MAIHNTFYLLRNGLEMVKESACALQVLLLLLYESWSWYLSHLVEYQNMLLHSVQQQLTQVYQRPSVEALCNDVLPSPPAENNEPWYTATRRKKQSKKKRNNAGTEARASACGMNQHQHTFHVQSINVQRTGSQQTLVNFSKEQLVPGARHIWGTLRTCTVPTVVNSIARLTNVGDNVLKVKRKFKTGIDGKVTRWWYVIHAEEACLQQLESEWQKVEVQTSWKLEPCYRYLESDEQTPLSREQCPLPEGESEAAPLDPAPAVLSQRQEAQRQWRV